MHAHIHPYTRLHTHSHAYLYIHSCAQTYTNTDTYRQARLACMHTQTVKHPYVHTHACTHVHMHARRHTHACIARTHTCTHTHYWHLHSRHISEDRHGCVTLCVACVQVAMPWLMRLSSRCEKMRSWEVWICHPPPSPWPRPFLVTATSPCRLASC